jgi:hypothetical protein
MVEGELRDVLVVSGSTVLAVDTDGRWFGRSARRQPWPAGDYLLWLLPILDQSCVDVSRAVEAVADTGASLLTDVVGFALREGTDGWIERALSWLEAGYTVAPFADLLGDLKDRAHLAQPVRHRALRLWLNVREHR